MLTWCIVWSSKTVLHPCHIFKFLGRQDTVDKRESQRWRLKLLQQDIKIHVLNNKQTTLNNGICHERSIKIRLHALRSTAANIDKRLVLALLYLSVLVTSLVLRCPRAMFNRRFSSHGWRTLSIGYCFVFTGRLKEMAVGWKNFHANVNCFRSICS